MAKQPTHELPQCSICLDVARDPRRLPCLHMYCRICLEQLIERCSGQVDVFQCPYCRYEHDIPDMGADAFPVAIAQRREITPDRHMSTVRCRLHNEEQNVFCLKCKRAICNLCPNTAHKGHPTEDITDFMRFRRKELESTIKELKNSISELNTEFALLKEKGKVLSESKEQDIANVRAQGKELKNNIDLFVKNYATRIEGQYGEVHGRLKEQSQKLQKKREGIQNLVYDAESIVAHNSKDRLLFDFETFMQQTETLLSQKIVDDTDTIQDVFTKGDCVKEKLQAMLGTVKVRTLRNMENKHTHIFPVGPSLRPCKKYPVLPSIQIARKTDETRSTEDLNARENTPITRRMLRKLLYAKVKT